MQALARLSQFIGKTFAVWTLLFATLAFFSPDTFKWIAPYIVTLLGIVMFGMGLLLGYLLAKATGLNVAQRKTMSIEVGMQNSGLGVALATAHFSPLAAVPSAIFSVWHNISGPIAATLFQRFKNDAEDARQTAAPAAAAE